MLELDRSIRNALAPYESDPDILDAMLHARAALRAETWADERRQWIAIIDLRGKVRGSRP